MTHVFADTGYWMALLNPRDALHRRAKELASTLKGVKIITSDWVLIEVLNGFAGSGPHLRSIAANAVSSLVEIPGVVVEARTDNIFTNALALYCDRADKEWSMTDCSSFLIMRECRIDSSLTPDRHFEQASFKALLR